MNTEPQALEAQPARSVDAAYRRLTAVILRLDVATLARELRDARLLTEYLAPAA